MFKAGEVEEPISITTNLDVDYQASGRFTFNPDAFDDGTTYTLQINSEYTIIQIWQLKLITRYCS